MATPLILKGNLKLGADALSAVDVSDEVTAFKVMGEAETIEIPATLATPRGNRGGSATFSLEIGYLSNDEADTVFSLLWDAITSDSKEIYFEGSMRDGAISASNPLWSGTAIVTAAAVGGEAEALSQESATFPLVGEPTKATTDS